VVVVFGVTEIATLVVAAREFGCITPVPFAKTGVMVVDCPWVIVYDAAVKLVMTGFGVGAAETVTTVPANQEGGTSPFFVHVSPYSIVPV
jgi:hypothetical protein